ncbi:MAG: outer membrane protein assembly factor BamB [Legionellaceae bacterium]|nr:outer membrane protein assembly factor BamB [Legionellaceae bacterium]
MKKSVGIFLSALLLGVGLPSCTTIDDYMLGKDNTPQPAQLEAIKPRMDLVKNWSVPVGGAAKTASYSKMSPLITSNHIYTVSMDGVVNAIEKNSGKLIWSKRLPASIVSGPSVGNGYVAVTTGHSDIVLLKQDNGEQVWKVTVASEVLGKPLITKDALIAKTVDGNLSAFHLSSGKKRWNVHHGAPNLILKGSSSPILLPQNRVLTGYADGKLDVVELETGRLLWQRSIAYASGASDVERLVDIDANPLVEGDTVYLASYQGYIAALSLGNGEFKWRKPASVFKNISLADHSLYFTDSDDIIWSLNKQTGTVNWKQDKFKARGLTEPVIKGDRLFVADKTGMLHVLATHDGDYLSRVNVGAAVTIAPVVNKNQVFIQDSKGTLSQYQVG